ncbi:hypothetical protein [Vibrio sp. WXL103]|uniref:hypothetical protein n=1 Tax=Vibrio sp. WXL103 TaxID=3450710 RepID=UPI003EC6D98B
MNTFTEKQLTKATLKITLAIFAVAIAISATDANAAWQTSGETNSMTSKAQHFAMSDSVTSLKPMARP